MKQIRLMCSSFLVAMLFWTTGPLVQATTETTIVSTSASLSTTEISSTASQQGTEAVITPENSITAAFTTDDINEVEEAIIGEDDQYRVTDVFSLPYNAVVHLELHFGHGIGDASGVMIGPDLVLTVAHNVYSRSNQEWASKVLVTPMKNGEEAPYGIYTSTQFYINSQYPGSSGPLRRQTDIAILKLENPVAEGVGYLPVSTELSENERVQVAGYPADSDSKYGYMYTAFGETYDITEKTFTHFADTERGNSGSAILNSANEVVGVQSSSNYDYITPVSGTENFSRRVTPDVLEMIEVAKKNTVVPEQIATNVIFPTGVALTPTSAELTVGDTTPLTATVAPEEATDSSVSWTSSDPTVASVENGVVTAMAPGTVEITATTIMGQQVATAQITVLQKESTKFPVYRLYHPGLKAHLYTKDANEYQVLAGRGWKQEGVAFTSSKEEGEPVYRLYHSGLKVHLYTKDAYEYQTLASRGWKQEGEAYRSYGEVPVYRLYHSGIKKHLYTKDANEYQVLAKRGWKQEGLAFYAVK